MTVDLQWIDGAEGAWHVLTSGGGYRQGAGTVSRQATYTYESPYAFRCNVSASQAWMRVPEHHNNGAIPYQDPNSYGLWQSFHFMAVSLPASTVEFAYAFFQVSGHTIRARLRSDGKFDLWHNDGGTDTGTYVLSAGEWVQISFYTKQNDSGQLIIRNPLTGVVLDSLSVTTENHQIRNRGIGVGLGITNRTADYVFDNYASSCDAFSNFGDPFDRLTADYAIWRMTPNGEGFNQDQDSGAYTDVDESPYSSDYVELHGAVKEYSVTLSSPNSKAAVIKGVFQWQNAPTVAAGNVYRKPLIRLSGTNYVSSGSYGFHSSQPYDNAYLWNTNPDTAAEWNKTDLGAMEGGVQLNSGGEYLRIWTVHSEFAATVWRGGNRMILLMSEAWCKWGRRMERRASGLLAPRGFDKPILVPDWSKRELVTI